RGVRQPSPIAQFQVFVAAPVILKQSIDVIIQSSVDRTASQPALTGRFVANMSAGAEVLIVCKQVGGILRAYTHHATQGATAPQNGGRTALDLDRFNQLRIDECLCQMSG